MDSAAARTTAAATTLRMPPAFDDENSYEIWKEDLEIWCDLTDVVATKQALAVRLVLTGRARNAASQVKREDLKKENGVAILLKKLDSVFLVDKGRRQFSAFNELHNFQRAQNADVNEFVSGFEHVYFKFTEQDMTLPDAVLAFMLLRAANLGDVERKLVMSSIGDVSYNSMKSTLKKVFCDDAPAAHSALVPEIKSEPVFYGDGEDSDTAFYTRGGGRGRRQWRGSRGGGRGGQRVLTGANRLPVTARGGRRNNPVGSDGQASRCHVCGSRFHWARSCPDAYENMPSNDDTAEHEREENVQLSLFMGYTNGERNTKLEALLEESQGCAVLDSGCSNTVCGVQWFNNYIGQLTEYEMSKIVERSSTSTFTFGDGSTVPSIKKVTLPCYIGGVKSEITTDVVECNVPLLLSKRSMKTAEMVLDFKNDAVNVGGDWINLRCATSGGHYLLPISL